MAGQHQPLLGDVGQEAYDKVEKSAQHNRLLHDASWVRLFYLPYDSAITPQREE